MDKSAFSGRALLRSRGVIKRLFSLMALVCLILSMNVQNTSAANGVWTNIGPDGGDVRALAIDPVNTSTIYAGTYGGVYKSTDGG
ncbi:MAG: hypothetical protein HY758_10900, partial [Nitrospirae bacterium]|nr:hypothetical protein [Nitrospirota bacterium]